MEEGFLRPIRIQNLKMSVVAEGVETEEQYQLLKQVIDPEEHSQIQGFIFSKPVNEDEIVKLQSDVSNKWSDVNLGSKHLQ